MKRFQATLILILFTTYVYSQNFSKHSYTINGPCQLTSQMSNYDGNGNKVDVYQCMNQGNSCIYRVNVIKFKTTISDKRTYMQTVEKEYKKQSGSTTKTTLAGLPAVKHVEDVEIDGTYVKQISVNILHKNQSITLVLLTDNSNYDYYIKQYANYFSLNN